MKDSRTQFEREEDQLCEDVNSGRITQVEYQKAIREMYQDMRDEARERAQDAYDREMDRW